MLWDVRFGRGEKVGDVLGEEEASCAVEVGFEAV
jgi:hypothetical protein